MKLSKSFWKLLLATISFLSFITVLNFLREPSENNLNFVSYFFSKVPKLLIISIGSAIVIMMLKHREKKA